jgi:hypothetical protein
VATQGEGENPPRSCAASAVRSRRQTGRAPWGTTRIRATANPVARQPARDHRLAAIPPSTSPKHIKHNSAISNPRVVRSRTIVRRLGWLPQRIWQQAMSCPRSCGPRLENYSVHQTARVLLDAHGPAPPRAWSWCWRPTMLMVVAPFSYYEAAHKYRSTINPWRLEKGVGARTNEGNGFSTASHCGQFCKLNRGSAQRTARVSSPCIGGQTQ